MQVVAERQIALLRACLLDGEGGGSHMTLDEVRDWCPERGPLWVHLDVGSREAAAWLRDESGIDPSVCDALLAGETRPRARVVGGGLFVNLRGLNLNPGADPEDMVSIRVWVDEHRAISSRRRRLSAVGEVAGRIEEGRGPKDSASLLADLCTHTFERLSSLIDGLDSRLEELEDRALDGATDNESELAAFRRKVIMFRRYLAPQRDAMAVLDRCRLDWLSDKVRADFHEATDRVTHYVEELDELHGRAEVAHDLVDSRFARQLNRRMFILSVLAGVVLPPTLVTGLLGINVGGLPGAHSESAFLIVCAVLLALAALPLLVLRRLRWL